MSKKKEKSTNKKSSKIIAIVVTVVIIIAIIATIVVLKINKNKSSNENNVITQSVKIFTESINLFQNQYSGMVVAEDTIKIKKDTNQTIKDMYVEKGQEVKTGQKLFEYDTRENLNKIEQIKLEIEKMRNSITNDQKQIENLNNEKNANPDNQSVVIEIQSLENDIKQTEYNIKTKELEISNLNKDVKNAVVTSEIDGIIQNINDGETNNSYGYGQQPDDSYITIMKTGDFRIKGVVNEQNVMMFSEGQKVIIRSRIDNEKIWTGTISKVDTSNPESDQNNGYMMSANADEVTTSSKYPFYITLDSKDGLMIGQHVYIEFDYGQIEKSDGLWIPSYFVVEEGENSYVWVAGNNDKLEKRKVKIEQKDENLLEVKITEGLTENDYIASPEDTFTEGLKVNKYDSIEDIPLDDSAIMEPGMEGIPEIDDTTMEEPIQTEEMPSVEPGGNQ